MFKHPRPVLVFQQDPEHTAFLVDFFRLEGYNAHSAYSRLMFLERLRQEDFEAVVLEGHQDEATRALIDAVLAMKSVPMVVVFKTPYEAAWLEQWTHSQVVGLGPKPAPMEIRHWVHELIHDFERQTSVGQTLTVGELVLLPDQEEAKLAGQKLSLTMTEFTLLELLTRYQGQAIRKPEIYQRVLGRAMQRYDRAIDVHISTLRHKMNEIKPDAIHIESIRGVGYRLVPARRGV